MNESEFCKNRRKLMKMLETRARRHAQRPRVGEVHEIIGNVDDSGEKCEILREDKTGVKWNHYGWKATPFLVRLSGNRDTRTRYGRHLRLVEWESRLPPRGVMVKVIADMNQVKVESIYDWTREADRAFKRVIALWESILPGASKR